MAYNEVVVKEKGDSRYNDIPYYRAGELWQHADGTVYIAAVSGSGYCHLVSLSEGAVWTVGSTFGPLSAREFLSQLKGATIEVTQG